MIKYKIMVQIDNIEIDEKYYSFKWKALVGKKKYSGKYDSDYDGYTKKEMVKILEKGYALEIVLERLGQGA